MKPPPPLSKPLKAEALEGEVVLISPGKGDVKTALTPEAAKASLPSLKQAALEAEKQRGVQDEAVTD
jgi:hypothetical protein